MQRYPATMNATSILATLDLNGRADGGDALKVALSARGDNGRNASAQCIGPGRE